MYLQKHINGRHRFHRNFFKIFALFFVAIILVLVVNIFDSARVALYNASLPLFKTGNYLSENFFPPLNIFSDKNKLIKENTELLYEIENMRLNLIDYESLKEENQKLREEMGLKPIGVFITARVIAKPPQIPLDSLILDVGTNDSLNNGSIVLAGSKFLIGKIVKVSSDQATVALNSFPGTTLYGYIARTNEPLEITGIGGGSMQAKVPIDFEVQVSDKIMVEGRATYIAAIVAAIEEDSSSGFKEILMSLPANISKTKFVFVEPSVVEIE